jgi:hypothetical protein
MTDFQCQLDSVIAYFCVTLDEWLSRRIDRHKKHQFGILSGKQY